MKWKFLFGSGLIIISILLYLLQYAVFKNARDTIFYFIQDLAFVSINVLLVTLFIAWLLNEKEKRVLLNKLNIW